MELGTDTRHLHYPSRGPEFQNSREWAKSHLWSEISFMGSHFPVQWEILQKESDSSGQVKRGQSTFHERSRVKKMMVLGRVWIFREWQKRRWVKGERGEEGREMGKSACREKVPDQCGRKKHIHAMRERSAESCVDVCHAETQQC